MNANLLYFVSFSQITASSAPLIIGSQILCNLWEEYPSSFNFIEQFGKDVEAQRLDF